MIFIQSHLYVYGSFNFRSILKDKSFSRRDLKDFCMPGGVFASVFLFETHFALGSNNAVTEDDLKDKILSLEYQDYPGSVFRTFKVLRSIKKNRDSNLVLAGVGLILCMLGFVSYETVNAKKTFDKEKHYTILNETNEKDAMVVGNDIKDLDIKKQQELRNLMIETIRNELCNNKFRY